MSSSQNEIVMAIRATSDESQCGLKPTMSKIGGPLLNLKEFLKVKETDDHCINAWSML